MIRRAHVWIVGAVLLHFSLLTSATSGGRGPNVTATTRVPAISLTPRLQNSPAVTPTSQKATRNGWFTQHSNKGRPTLTSSASPSEPTSNSGGDSSKNYLVSSTPANKDSCSYSANQTVGYPPIRRNQWLNGTGGYILESFTFPCDGHLSAWKVYLAGAQNVKKQCTARIGIFRRVFRSKRVYRLVYSETITASKTSAAQQSNLTNSTLAWVTKGDVLAVAVTSGSSLAKCLTFSGPSQASYFQKLCRWTGKARQQYVDCSKALPPSMQLVFFSLQATTRTRLYCQYEDEVDENGNVYRWYPRATGTVVKAQCPCQRGKFAYRTCQATGSYAAWTASNMTACTWSVSQCSPSNISGLMQVQVTTSNMPNMLGSTANMLRKMGAGLTKANITETAKLLRNISHTAKYSRVSQESFVSFAKCIGDMLLARGDILKAAQRENASANSVLQSIDDFADSMNITNSSAQVVTNQVAFSVKGTRKSAFMGSTMSVFLSKNSSSSSTLSLNITERPKKLLTTDTSAASFVLPRTVMSAATVSVVEDDRDEVIVLFNAFHKTDLFLPTSGLGSGGKEGELTSAVVGCRVGATSIENLTEPVAMSFELTAENITQPTCVYWNFNMNGRFGGWSSDGCSLVEFTTNPPRAICECTHLTNFAVIMNPNDQQLSSTHKKAFAGITYVGVGLSLFGLTITIISLAFIGNLWRLQFNRILCNFCISLAIVNILVLVITQVSKGSDGCKAIAILTHYFVLAVFLWSLIQAYNLYRSLVKVFSSQIENFVRKAAIFAWGFPAVIVFVTMAVGKFSLNAYDSKGETSCRLENPEFIGALFVPVCVILFISLTTVSYVVYIERKSNMKRGLQKRKMWQQSARLTLSSSILLGLTWLLGLFMLSESTANIAAQYIFAIFNSLLGFFIFIVKVVLPPDVRLAWRTLQFSPQSSTSSFRSNRTLSQSKSSTPRVTLVLAGRPSRTSADSVTSVNSEDLNGKPSLNAEIDANKLASSPTRVRLIAPVAEDDDADA